MHVHTQPDAVGDRHTQTSAEEGAQTPTHTKRGKRGRPADGEEMEVHTEERHGPSKGQHTEQGEEACS